MKLGIKVADIAEDIDRLKKTGTKFCEVRFIVEKAEKFQPLLDYIQEKKIQPNFHYWASFKDNILANPAAPGELGEQTVETIIRTIDIAAVNNAGYVVMHPGHTKKNKIDHKNGCIQPIETLASVNEAEKILIQRLKLLTKLAEDKGIQLLIETVPPFDPEKWMSAEGRLNTVDIGTLPMSTIEKIADLGYFIANDFEHTACNASQSESHSKIYSFLYQKTKKLASNTKLLHLGYIIPPYNGTDYHGNLTDPKFKLQDALPNIKEMQKLLALFKDRDDVWMIPEPATCHVGSYKIAQNIIRSLDHRNIETIKGQYSIR